MDPSESYTYPGTGKTRTLAALKAPEITEQNTQNYCVNYCVNTQYCVFAQ